MLANALRTLYGYNRWATERVLDAADRLGQEQFLAPADAEQRSVRDALVHMIGTQQGWLSWWDGSLTAEEAYRLSLPPADFTAVAAVRQAWRVVERQTDAFVSGLGDDDAAQIYAHTPPDGVEVRIALWQMMLHVANHSTQHRSEVAAQLTGWGESPGDLDLFFYIRSGEVP